MQKKELIQYLNDLLMPQEFQDDSANGLQVDTPYQEINKIWYAVDATSYIFDKAIDEQVDMIITHHWLFWWFEQTLTESHYDRIAKLIKNDIWLYASHLPLDTNMEVGNNIGIMQAFIKHFGIDDYAKFPFGRSHGQQIGIWIKFEQEVPIHSILMWFCDKMQFTKKLYNFAGNEFIQSLAIVSWGWWPTIFEAKKDNYDLLLTGETEHRFLINAKDIKQSLILCWHRETEKIWVKLLANRLTKEFGVETVFLDEKY